MLTRDQVEQAAPGPRRYEIADRDGLVLRVTPTGTKSWAIWVYRGNGRRRITLGKYPKMGLQAAREARDRVHAQRRRGDDMPLEAVAQLYLDDARTRKRSADQDARRIERAILPQQVQVGPRRLRLGDVEVARVTRDHVFEVYDEIRDRGATEEAARVHAVLRALLNFAVRRGFIDANPAAAAGIRQGPSRSRALTLDELSRWWPRVRGCGSPGAHLALAMALATAARIGEVLSIERYDLDEHTCTWVIPAEKAKTGAPHAIPLSTLAREVIAAARREWPGSRFLIPLSADTVRKHCRETIEAAGLPRLTPHDVRRTVATQLARAGTERLVIEKILGHTDASTTGRYDRYDREDEQRRALEVWSERVRPIVWDSPPPDPHPGDEETATTSARHDPPGSHSMNTE